MKCFSSSEYESVVLLLSTELLAQVPNARRLLAQSANDTIIMFLFFMLVCDSTTKCHLVVCVVSQ